MIKLKKFYGSLTLVSSLFTSSLFITSQAYAANCTYKVDSEWNTGFTASIAIKNDGTQPINGWSVNWKYDQNLVTSGWNAVLTGTNPYSAKNFDFNKIIDPGQSVSLGFQGSKNGGEAETPEVTGDICESATSAEPSAVVMAAAINWVACASERQTCSFTGTKRVRYGAGTNWVEGVYTNSVACNNTTFGDPIQGTLKACQTADVTWTTCAAENGTCTFTGEQIVRYGAGTTWVERRFTGRASCNNATFGDPLPGTVKSCQITPLATDTIAPTPPSTLRMSNLACRSGTLSWAASTDNVAVNSYDIYHDGQLMTSVGGNQLSAALTLTPGANWGLYVNAVDTAGNVSQASTSLSIQVPQCQVDTTPPTTPTSLRGTVSGISASLTWAASTDNIGVTAYDVYRNNVRVGSTSALSYVDSGLASNTTYQYSVSARDAQSNVSARSTTLALSTGSACSTPICTVTQVTTDTDIPWGLATLPDGTLLYSRRDAQDIIRLNPTTGAKTNIGKVPNVRSTDGEGGLLGVAVTPNFPATDPWLYIYHTSPTDNRIVRIQYKNGVLDTATLQVILSGIGRNKFHDGGRLRFGPDGKLYASTGDAQVAANAQNVNSLDGKILRLNSDGGIPSDNPFGNYVWSYGHRNPQGLAFDSQGRLWEQEFGNSVMDETNLIVKGGNYGWPNCEGTISQAGSGCNTAGYIAPKHTYSNAAASCSGITIVRDVLYVACLRGTRLYREVINGTSLINVQQFFVGTYGRLRTVEASRDGGLWLTTSNSGDKDSTANNSNEKIYKVTLGN